MWIQIRMLLQEQSDLNLHCLSKRLLKHFKRLLKHFSRGQKKTNFAVIKGLILFPDNKYM